MYVSRGLRLEQYLCSPACNQAVHHWAAWLGDGRRGQHNEAARPQSAVPTDPFAAQLQEKTEKELLQLLSQRHQRQDGQTNSQVNCGSYWTLTACTTGFDMSAQRYLHRAGTCLAETRRARRPERTGANTVW